MRASPHRPKFWKLCFIMVVLFNANLFASDDFLPTQENPLSILPMVIDEDDAEDVEEFFNDLEEQDSIETVLTYGFETYLTAQIFMTKSYSGLKSIKLTYQLQDDEFKLIWSQYTDNSEKHPVMVKDSLAQVIGWITYKTLYATTDSSHYRLFINPNLPEPNGLYTLYDFKMPLDSALKLIYVTRNYSEIGFIKCFRQNPIENTAESCALRYGIKPTGKYAILKSEISEVSKKLARIPFEPLLERIAKKGQTAPLVRDILNFRNENKGLAKDSVYQDLLQQVKNIILEELAEAPENNIYYRALLQMRIDWLDGKTTGQETLAEMAKGKSPIARAARDVLYKYKPSQIDPKLKYDLDAFFDYQPYRRAERLLRAKPSDPVLVKVFPDGPLISTLGITNSTQKGTVTNEEWATIVNPSYMHWLNRLAEAEKEVIAAGGKLVSNSKMRASSLRNEITKTYIAVQGSYVREQTTRSAESFQSQFAASSQRRFDRAVLAEAQNKYDFLATDPPPKMIRSKRTSQDAINQSVQVWHGTVAQNIKIEITGREPTFLYAESSDAGDVLGKRVSPPTPQNSRTLSMDEAKEIMVEDMSKRIRVELRTIVIAEDAYQIKARINKLPRSYEQNLQLHLFENKPVNDGWSLFDMSKPILN